MEFFRVIVLLPRHTLRTFLGAGEAETTQEGTIQYRNPFRLLYLLLETTAIFPSYQC